MKKQAKYLLALVVMAVALVVAGGTAEAATKTKKLTMFVGEEFSYSYIGLGSLKSVKSSKPGVVSAKNNKKTYTILKAKKVGKSKVTVQGLRGNYVFDITVKKINISVSLPQPMVGTSYYCVQVKNGGSGYFSRVTAKAHLYDVNGTELGTEDVTISYLGAKKTGIDYMYVSSYKFPNLDISRTTYDIDYSRSQDYKHSDYSKKVKYKVSEGTDNYGEPSVIVNIKVPYNKSKGGIYAAYSVLFYDAAGNLIEVTERSDYLYSKEKTGTATISKPSNAVRYEIVAKRAYLEVYK